MRDSADDQNKIRALFGGFLGLTYIVLGLVGSTIAIRGSDPIVFFWFPGSVRWGRAHPDGHVQRHEAAAALDRTRDGGSAGRWPSHRLVDRGPILSIALIVLRISRSPAPSTSAA